jgi:hypothetical protein
MNEFIIKITPALKRQWYYCPHAELKYHIMPAYRVVEV